MPDAQALQTLEVFTERSRQTSWLRRPGAAEAARLGQQERLAAGLGQVAHAQDVALRVR